MLTTGMTALLTVVGAAASTALVKAVKEGREGHEDELGFHPGSARVTGRKRQLSVDTLPPPAPNLEDRLPAGGDDEELIP